MVSATTAPPNRMTIRCATGCTAGGRAEVVEQRLAQEHAVGHVLDDRVLGRAVLEADAVAHLLAQAGKVGGEDGGGDAVGHGVGFGMGFGGGISALLFSQLALRHVQV